MSGSPFEVEVLWRIGPLAVSRTLLYTWLLTLALVGAAALATRRLERRPGRLQSALELFVLMLDAQIVETMRADPARYRALIGTLFLFVFVANALSLVPGVVPPTAALETDAALALLVLGASVFHGVRVRGARGYLGSFAEPLWLMVPLNVLGHLTRTLAMTVRLFGNVASGVFVVAIVASLAGLFVPIPLMALDLLGGTVQAYIFAVLAMVFIAAAIETPPARAGGPGASGARGRDGDARTNDSSGDDDGR